MAAKKPTFASNRRGSALEEIQDGLLGAVLVMDRYTRPDIAATMVFPQLRALIAEAGRNALRFPTVVAWVALKDSAEAKGLDPTNVHARLASLVQRYKALTMDSITRNRVADDSVDNAVLDYLARLTATLKRGHGAEAIVAAEPADGVPTPVPTESTNPNAT